ncbi:MAG TPA: hypothetical protein VEU94_05795 [Terriglobales bacterium]|nr:hypothetical protein [Terriglobales bacterium]
MIRSLPHWIVGILLILSLDSKLLSEGEQNAQPATPASSGNPFDKFEHFSATLHGGLGRDQDRKIYRSGNLMRLDFANHYRITDMELPATWAVMPDRCARFPMPDAGTWPFFGLRNHKAERSVDPGSSGKETVDGHACRVERLTFVGIKSTATIKMKLWEADDLQGFPIKIEVNNLETGRLYTITYTGVSLDPPDPKLFEHPGTCDSISKPPRKK